MTRFSVSTGSDTSCAVAQHEDLLRGHPVEEVGELLAVPAHPAVVPERGPAGRDPLLLERQVPRRSPRSAPGRRPRGASSWSTPGRSGRGPPRSAWRQARPRQSAGGRRARTDRTACSRSGPSRRGAGGEQLLVVRPAATPTPAGCARHPVRSRRAAARRRTGSTSAPSDWSSEDLRMAGQCGVQRAGARLGCSDEQGVRSEIPSDHAGMLARLRGSSPPTLPRDGRRGSRTRVRPRRSRLRLEEEWVNTLSFTRDDEDGGSSDLRSERSEQIRPGSGPGRSRLRLEEERVNTLFVHPRRRRRRVQRSPQRAERAN